MGLAPKVSGLAHTVSLPSAPCPLETSRVQEVESYTAHTQRHFGPGILQARILEWVAISFSNSIV